jgi:hypothetical protein
MKAFLAVLWSAVSLFAQVAFAQSVALAPTVAQLLGTWQLVSIEETIAGKTQPTALYGAQPVGFLMYQSDGHMCAELSNGDLPEWKDPAKATDAQKIAYYGSFVAYCGTFKLDAEHSTVYHYPTVAWSPSYVGSTQPRPFRLEGDKLIITTTKGLPDPKMEKLVLVWQRAKTSAP